MSDNEGSDMLQSAKVGAGTMIQDISAAFDISLLLRTKFSTTAVFHANLLTDKAGVVTFPLKMPDNIGTYEIRAVAASKYHQFGTAQKELISRRPLSLQPSLPRGKTFFL